MSEPLGVAHLVRLAQFLRVQGKIRHPWILLGVPMFGGVIAYNLKSGVAYNRVGVIYEATNPDAFWMAVCGEGLFILMTLFAFFMAQAGDGWNDDG